MFGRKCSSPGYGFVSGILFYFIFFGSLEREPSLWENTWPWEILRTWESFPGIRLGNQDLWGGEKESTFDTGRRVETGTYHWEGRKPFIQTFDLFLHVSPIFQIRIFHPVCLMMLPWNLPIPDSASFQGLLLPSMPRRRAAIIRRRLCCHATQRIEQWINNPGGCLLLSFVGVFINSMGISLLSHGDFINLQARDPPWYQTHWWGPERGLPSYWLPHHHWCRGSPGRQGGSPGRQGGPGMGADFQFQDVFG